MAVVYWGNALQVFSWLCLGMYLVPFVCSKHSTTGAITGKVASLEL